MEKAFNKAVYNVLCKACMFITKWVKLEIKNSFLMIF